MEFLAYLTQNTDKVVSLSEVSGNLRLPYRIWAQVAIGLRGGGIIEGKEGKNGGYVLAKKLAKKKSMYDLLEALGENKGLVECLGNKSACIRAGSCYLRDIWQRVEGGIFHDLKK